MSKHVTITPKELAEAYGIKIKELSEMTEYSRQGLYLILSKKSVIPRPRLNLMVHLLEEKSQEIYEAELRQAFEKREKRLRALDILRDY